MAISTCRACGAVFQSLKGFDAHRVGKFEKRDDTGKVILQRKTRHCLTAAELQKKGLTQNKQGRWITSQFDAAQRLFDPDELEAAS